MIQLTGETGPEDTNEMTKDEGLNVQDLPEHSKEPSEGSISLTKLKK